jgi:transcriptional regulator with XRE-family HTH domain
VTTAERPDEDQLDDDRARAIVRAFWLEDIQGLRDRHDQQRRDQNRPPITNKEIAKETGIPQSTLSDLLTNKRNTVPDWDRVCLIIDCLGGTTREWVPKWRAARASFDAMG